MSKKVAKRAVDRHLVKRRVYDAFARAGDVPPASYVFFAKANAHTILYRDLRAEVGSLLDGARRMIESARRIV